MDVRGLAFLRIALATILIVDLIGRWGAIDLYQSDVGMVRPSPWIGSGGDWSIHRWFPGPTGQRLLSLAAISAAGAMLLNRGGRTIRFVCLAALISLHHHQPLVLNGGDILLRCMLWWLCLAPTTTFRQPATAETIDADHPDRPNRRTALTNAATFALIVQLATVYLTASLFKRGPLWQVDAVALHDALHVDHGVKPLGVWLRQFPAVTSALTRATVPLETYVPLLLFIPGAATRTRPIVITLLGGFHLATFLLMDLGWFPWVAIASLTALAPPRWWNVMERRTNRWLPVSLVSPPSTDGLPTTDAVDRHPPPAWRSMLTYGLLSLALWQCVRTLRRPDDRVPTGLTRAAVALGLDQRWDMFAAPMRDDGCLVPEVRLIDGRTIDWVTGDRVTDRKPDAVADRYRDFRERKYVVGMISRGRSDEQWRWTDALIRLRPPPGVRPADATAVRLVFWFEPTTPAGNAPPIRRILGEQQRPTVPRSGD